MRETGGSAAAPAASCRNCLRWRSFIVARPAPTDSFDHLVGAGKQRRWDFEAQRPRGLEVDDQLELSWLHDRQIAGLLAPEYPIDIRRCVSEQIRDIHAIGSQATLGEHKPEWIDRGQ